MKRGLTAAFVSILLFTSGCSREVILTQPDATMPVTSATIVETTAPTSQTVNTTPSGALTPTDATEASAATVRKSDDVAAVLAEIYPGDEEDKELIRMIMTQAKNLNVPPTKALAGEEDAIARTREVLTAAGYASWIESAESDYVELNGRRIRYVRSNTPYTVEYFEEQDLWYVQPNPSLGTTEDGRKIAAPSMSPYVLLRGSNGEVLALFA